jgi:medium-chain acyl-[acyl-carrier-protein] hydrolase
LRLFCLPHAGGSAMLYRPWRGLFPAGVDLCPIELPGHGARLGETAFTRMAPLVDALSAALQPLLSVPFAFFGHSMGAAIAYELARNLHRPTGPVHLFVSARPAPDPAFEPRALHRLPDADLLAALTRIGGTPAAVLARADLMAALLPGIRADLELIETYAPADGSLNCPISAFGGAEDRMTHRRSLDAWAGFTRREFRRCLFPGGHFYLAESAAAVVAEILRDLDPG